MIVNINIGFCEKGGRMTVNSETQYSIYKINFESVESVFSDISHGRNNTEYAENIITVLINSTIDIIKKKPGSSICSVSYQGLKGVVFKTTHYPSWGNVAEQIIGNNELQSQEMDNDFLTNTNVSYIYFYLHNEKIFAVTGGYGSNYISKFTEKNFGLYLLPKIIKKDNSVIKSILQNNLLGNQTASQRTNKNSTSIQNEQDMSSIFRQLSIEATRDIAENLGITFNEEESQSKRINIVNKDSIVIHRSISIAELKQVINRICIIEEERDNFALNYLVLARKKGLKNNDLYNALIQTLVDEKFDNFMLTGDDYTTFLTCANKYFIKDGQTDEILLESEEPITFSDVINLAKNKNKSTFNRVLKNWTISTIDDAGNLIQFPIQIFDAIQGFIEFGEKNQPCYLFNGQWYVFDSKFSDILTSEFKELFNQQLEKRKTYTSNFDLIKNSSTEELYNTTIKKEGKYLVSHTALINNVEIADIIIFNDEQIFLMHNKDSFSGTGARDVSNQVLTSASYLQQMLSSVNRDDFLENYYDAIASKYGKEEKVPIDKTEFKKRFQGVPKIHYLIGYLEGYDENSRSTYAKYLTVELINKLLGKGMDCTPLLIGK